MVSGLCYTAYPKFYYFALYADDAKSFWSLLDEWKTTNSLVQEFDYENIFRLQVLINISFEGLILVQLFGKFLDHLLVF